MWPRPVIHTHDTDPPRNEMAHAAKRLFRVINNEHSFACYIMKEVCLQSGNSGLTFDPDTAAMFSTSKSSRFNRKSVLETTVFLFFISPSPRARSLKQIRLPYRWLELFWWLKQIKTVLSDFFLIFLSLVNLTQSSQPPGFWLLQWHTNRADVYPISSVCCIPGDTGHPLQSAGFRAPKSAIMSDTYSRCHILRPITALCLLLLLMLFTSNDLHESARRVGVQQIYQGVILTLTLIFY